MFIHRGNGIFKTEGISIKIPENCGVGVDGEEFPTEDFDSGSLAILDEKRQYWIWWKIYKSDIGTKEELQIVTDEEDTGCKLLSEIEAFEENGLRGHQAFYRGSHWNFERVYDLGNGKLMTFFISSEIDIKVLLAKPEIQELLDNIKLDSTC